jgi:DNA polymerase-3 subunit delta
MIYLIYGEDTFRSRQKINQIKENFKKEDKLQINLETLDAGEIGFAEIQEKVKASPFLAEKRLIIIKNLLMDGAKQLQEKVIEIISDSQIPRTSDVIFWEAGEPKKSKLFKILAKSKNSLQFTLLSGFKLNRWIEDGVRERGFKIERKAVEKLAAYAGSDLWQMTNEIEKIVAFKSQASNTILSEDIDLLVRAKLDTNIFNFVDALARKDKREALRLLHEQIDLGQNEIYLLTMITYQIRNLLIIKDLVEQGKNSYQISRLSKIHPYVISKTLGQVRKFNLAELKNIYRNLLEVDIAFKTSKPNSLLILDLLVTKLCS